MLRAWASPVAQLVKKLPAMQETWVRSLGWEGPLEKGKATHSSILAWRIPQTEEPGSYSPPGHKESDTTPRVRFHFQRPFRGAWLLNWRNPPLKAFCVPKCTAASRDGYLCACAEVRAHVSVHAYVLGGGGKTALNCSLLETEEKVRPEGGCRDRGLQSRGMWGPGGRGREWGSGR